MIPCMLPKTLVVALAAPCILFASTASGFTPPMNRHTTFSQTSFHTYDNSNKNAQRGSSLPDERQTNIKMSLVPSSTLTAGVAAITGVVSGGLVSGSLHAISGPDHLAALLPKCVGQRWFRAGRVGLIWGVGHGISALLLGLVGFGLKSKLASVGPSKLLQSASSATEVAVGLSLIVIGLLGIREAREWEEEIEGGLPQSLSAAAVESGIKSTPKRAVLFNGLLHGLSWDGAPSLAPALATASWRGSISFLLAYSVGTIAAMAAATTIIGELTRRAGEVLQRPDLPQKMSLFSSLIAIAVGGVWCSVAFL